MILYSERDNHYSHRVRIVLAEKDIACEIREFNIEEAPDDILSVSPYPVSYTHLTLPTMDSV